MHTMPGYSILKDDFPWTSSSNRNRYRITSNDAAPKMSLEDLSPPNTVVGRTALANTLSIQQVNSIVAITYVTHPPSGKTPGVRLSLA